MKEVRIPYGSVSLPFLFRGDSLEVLEPTLMTIAEPRSDEEVLMAALEHPIGMPALDQLAKDKKTAVVIISDHTRPVPSHIITPLILSKLREGNPDIAITILVATGCHRGTTEEELISKLGSGLVRKERIIVHDCDSLDDMIDIGELPSGARLRLNRRAIETDLLIAEGFVEPHFFAGFSGGRKSVLPGICARQTVMENHNAQFIADEFARAGVLKNNPLHRDMVHAAKLAKLQYVVNVILGKDKKIVGAFAGDPFAAHEAACEELKSSSAIFPAHKGDIVVTSNGGAPLDQNIYQTVKGMSTAEAAANDGAIIVMCAKCEDGIGGESFYRAIRDCVSLDHLEREIMRTPSEQTKPDQWQYQILVRILKKHRVFFVTEPGLKDVVENMKMEYFPTLDAAMAAASAIKPQGHVVVIPDGVTAIVC